MSGHLHSAHKLADSQPETVLQLLIVEDDPEQVECIVLALEAAAIQFSYQTINQLPQLKTLLQVQRWDAVLSNFWISGANVHQVFQILERAEVEIPLILVTSRLGEEVAVECIRAGITDYVLKEQLCRLPAVLLRSLREHNLRRQHHLAMQQAQQRATQESLINQIVQAMRGTLVFEEVLQTTVDRLHVALGVSRCLVFLPNVAQQIISQYVSYATMERQTWLNVRCPLFDCFSDRLTQAQIIQLNSTRHAEQIVQHVTSQFGIRAILMVPLVYQSTYHGGICLHQCDRERNWTADEVSMVRAIADQCAIAISQAQLVRHLQYQAQQEQLLNQIGRNLNSSLDPDYILQGIVNMTGECFKVDRAFIFAVADDEVRVTHEWRSTERVISMLSLQASVSNWLGIVNPETGNYFTKPVHLPDNQTLPLNQAQLACLTNSKRKSLLSVPIYIRDQFFGGIELHTTVQQRVFTNDEITLLQRIADQAAIALYNAQSYEHLEALVQERTQELAAEKHLSDAASRAKSEFLATMSHELRTPLTSILGFSSVLLKQVFGTLNDKQIHYLNNIHTSGEHLLELINDLLDLSKIEAGREELLLEYVSVEEMCDVCLSAVQEQVVSKGLILNCNITPELTCTVDRRRLKQILLNLLSNAVKFTDAGSVTLTVSQVGDRLHFAVQDTGIGIASADLNQLFQPFHQLQSGLDRKYQGTGLGLALAHKLAQLHGGTIHVTSVLGEGSCFTLELPNAVNLLN